MTAARSPAARRAARYKAIKSEFGQTPQTRFCRMTKAIQE